jgi:E3 ubiquitin-protein ligase MARCH5
MDILSENTFVISPPNSITFSKHCWICCLTDEHEDSSVIWLAPCRCRGIAKWVHQECLQRWIDEQQQRSNESKFFFLHILIILY